MAVDPAGQNRLPCDEDVVAVVTIRRGKRLHVIEHLGIVQPPLDEGCRHQCSAMVLRNQERSGVGCLVQSCAKFRDLLFVRRGPIAHQRLTVYAKRGGSGVTRLFSGNGENLVVVNARRQINITGDIPYFLQRRRVIDVPLPRLDHDRDR